LYPLLALQLFLFFFHPWYYKARDASLVEQVKEQSYAGLALTSFAAIRDTASLDDHVIQGIRGLTDGRENAVVLWNEGPTPWRKASYYLRDRPVVALEGGPNGALARYFRGNTIERQIEGRSSITIDLPAGARLVWLIRPSGPFLSSLGAAFPLIQEGPLYYHDLPSEHGAALVGSYRLRW
jgi:hypothetical protein